MDPNTREKCALSTFNSIIILQWLATENLDGGLVVTEVESTLGVVRTGCYSLYLSSSWVVCKMLLLENYK